MASQGCSKATYTPLKTKNKSNKTKQTKRKNIKRKKEKKKKNQNTDMNFLKWFKYYLTCAAAHFLNWNRHSSQTLVHRKINIKIHFFKKKVSVVLNNANKSLNEELFKINLHLDNSKVTEAISPSISEQIIKVQPGAECWLLKSDHMHHIKVDSDAVSHQLHCILQPTKAVSKCPLS